MSMVWFSLEFSAEDGVETADDEGSRHDGDVDEVSHKICSIDGWMDLMLMRNPFPGAAHLAKR